MLAKPQDLIDREQEWTALDRFVERGQRLAIVYGPRRVGKSFLLDRLCDAAGGRHYQAITGVETGQLADFGRLLGDLLGAGPLALAGWPDALDRLAKADLPFLTIDELPYLSETSPELPSLLQRYVDAGEGPPLILSGSSLSVMRELVDARAPLYGRAATVLVPGPMEGRDLAELWQAEDPRAALWVDAALGGLPGYRPLVASPRGDLDRWMVEEVLAPGSPLLDAAAADLANLPEPQALRGVHRAVLTAIAAGEHTFGKIARVAGLASGALSRPLNALQRAGLVVRLPDPLRERRDRYELADPHLRFWLALIAPNRSRLQAGAAAPVWEGARETTWPSQILGPRWETVVRSHLAATEPLGPVDAIGATTVSDRSRKHSHEVDLVATRGGRVVAIGEAKLRALGEDDLRRLRRIRELLGAPDAALVLASATAVEIPRSDRAELVAIEPRDVYGQ